MADSYNGSGYAGNRDKDVLENGRQSTLGEEVVVSLRERIVNKLLKKLRDLEEGRRTTDIWDVETARRGKWLENRKTLLDQYDEFIDPIHTAAQDWSSTLHLPVTFTIMKTVHARMLSALLDVDPPFSMKAREGALEERVDKASAFLRYAIRDWANEGQGVASELDAWVWSWCEGSGVLKARWERKYTRFMDVVQEPIVVHDQAEDGTLVPLNSVEEVEKWVTVKTFDGPILENKAPEQIILVGGKGDPQKADEVLELDYLTAGQLWTLVDKGIFEEDAVKKVIEYGESSVAADYNSSRLLEQAARAGTGHPDKSTDALRYAIIERYARIDVEGSGIPSDVILWVHKETGEILRATYLYRTSRSGMRPYFKADFHKRHGQDWGVGLPELLFTLQQELDAIHNMKVDFGLLTSMPMYFYRPTSNMPEERLPLEPGTGIPLDNPQSDVFIPNFGTRTVFHEREEQFLLGQVERMVSISDLNLGAISGQGATRTATGVQSLIAESNTNLNVFLRRLNMAWKQAVIYMFHMLQDKTPPGKEFRVTGENGAPIYSRIDNIEEIAGMYDIELDSNSANSNQSVKEAVATELYQLTGNPLDVQLGIITPLNRYEALKNLVQVRGIKDFNRFLTEPHQFSRIFTPEEVVSRVLRGVDIALSPDQDLQGVIAYIEKIYSDDMLLGQFNEQQTVKLETKRREAQQMLQALESQAAQQRNSDQLRINAAMSSPSPGGTPVSFNAPTGGRIGPDGT